MKGLLKKPIYQLLIGFITIQCFSIYYFPSFRNDEVQYIMGLEQLKWSVFFSPGFDKLLTGGQSLAHLLFYLMIKIFGITYWLKIVPIILVLLSIILLYKSLEFINFKYRKLFIILLILHPNTLFITTDFKQYSSDFFFMSLVFYIFTLKRNSIILCTITSILIFFFSIPASILLVFNIFYSLANNLKSKWNYIYLALVGLGTSYYQIQFFKNNPGYLPFMKSHWANFNRAMGPFQNSYHLIFNDVMYKLKSLFFVFSTSKFSIIHYILFAFPFLLIKKNTRLFLIYISSICFLIASSIFGYYPIPNFNFDIIPNLIDYRTLYFTTPLLIGMIFLTIVKTLKNENLQQGVIIVLLIFTTSSPNHLKNYFQYFKTDEAEIIESIVNKYGKVNNLVVTDWEINLYRFYKIKTNGQFNIINEYSYLNSPETFQPNDQIFFVLNKKDPNLKRFKADNRLRQVDANIQFVIFDMPLVKLSH